MKKKTLIAISICTGLFMALSWAKTMTLGFLMLCAFVPILFIEDYIANDKQKRFSSAAVFSYTYPAFFIFAFVNTWWISNASFIGYIVPIAEAAFMSVIMQIYSYSKRVAKNKQGAYFFLILYWIAFEYIQFKWDINFPWLNLGNSFAHSPVLVQWYSVLGMEGGTLWILLTNILLYLTIKDFYIRKQNINKITPRLFGRFQYIVFTSLIIVLPIIWSLCLWYSYEDNYSKTVRTVIIQPNLDPYNEQYVLAPEEVIDRVERLSKPIMDDSVDYMLLPESCIQEYAWEEDLYIVPSVIELRRFALNYQNAEIIAGLSTRKLLPQGVKTDAAREMKDSSNRFYESCNTAMLINRDMLAKDYQLRHKSVLVVGVEKLPFKKYLPFIEKFALNMGGTVGSLGVDDSAKVFTNKDKGIKMAVPICWESIDGNYVRDFIRQGAQVIYVVTNVGWWGDTPGYKQYFAISALRSIENRRYTAICANTGYSGLINARGQVVDRGNYWQQQAFKYDVPLLNESTFFTRHGDMLMRPFTFFSVLLLFYSIIRKKTKKED